MECHGTFVPPVKIFYIRGSRRVNWFAVDLWREKCALDHGIFEKKYTLTFVVSVVYSAGMSSKGPTLLRFYVIKKYIYLWEDIPTFKVKLKSVQEICHDHKIAANPTTSPSSDLDSGAFTKLRGLAVSRNVLYVSKYYQTDKIIR